MRERQGHSLKIWTLTMLVPSDISTPSFIASAPQMPAKRYKVGSKCESGQIIAVILGQSSVASVYTTKDNHLRWEYFKNGGRLPSSVKPAISRFDSLMARIAGLNYDTKAKKPLYYLLGKRLFSALDSGLTEPISSYFRPVELMIADKNTKAVAKRKSGTRRVFIVHGRDEAAKEGLARYLTLLELKPVILHEQASGGRTIIEKFEAHSDVDFAVVLLTPDDLGGLNDNSGKVNPRARQNVIFELGYFCGILGRTRVAALYKGGVELPSDYHGVVFITMDDAGAWRVLLAGEIKKAGLIVDLNKALK